MFLIQIYWLSAMTRLWGYLGKQNKVLFLMLGLIVTKCITITVVGRSVYFCVMLFTSLYFRLLSFAKAFFFDQIFSLILSWKLSPCFFFLTLLFPWFPPIVFRLLNVIYFILLLYLISSCQQTYSVGVLLLCFWEIKLLFQAYQVEEKLGLLISLCWSLFLFTCLLSYCCSLSVAVLRCRHWPILLFSQLNN